MHRKFSNANLATADISRGIEILNSIAQRKILNGHDSLINVVAKNEPVECGLAKAGKNFPPKHHLYVLILPA